MLSDVERIQDQIESKLLHFVSTQTACDSLLNVDTDLLQQGILDSLLVMDLILFAEQAFGVKLTGSSITPERFRTVRKLADTIQQYTVPDGGV